MRSVQVQEEREGVAKGLGRPLRRNVSPKEVPEPPAVTELGRRDLGCSRDQSQPFSARFDQGWAILVQLCRE